MHKILSTSVFLMGMIANSSYAVEPGQWSHVDTWDIQYSNESCMTMDSYQNGFLFGFAVNVSGNFFLLFGKSTWEIPNGEYNISIQIDNNSTTQIGAESLGKTVLASEIALSESNINLLRYGEVMHVRFGREQASFHLTGTATMLPELFRCSVALARAQNVSASNPFASGRSRNPFE